MKAAGAALLAALAGALCCACAKPPQVFGTLPDFQAQAVSSSGPAGEAASSTLRGRPWVADFFFVSCPGPCPAMSTRMAQLQKELPPRVGLLSFTVDPAHDTPEKLADYARRYAADPARWKFLRMPPAKVEALGVRGFKLGIQAHGLIAHSTKLVLLDSELRIRGYYDFDDDQALARLKRDAAFLASRR